MCQTSARWSYVCWLTSPLTLNCSAFLPTPRSTSLPCWPLSGRSLSLSIFSKVNVDTPQGFSFRLSIPVSARLPTASLQMLISLLPWLPCHLPRWLSVFHGQDTPGLEALMISLLCFWSIFIVLCVFLPLSWYQYVPVFTHRSVLSFWFTMFWSVCSTFTPVIHLSQMCVRGQPVKQITWLHTAH